MRISDDGFFLYSKNFGENSKILYILSKKNGLIKGLSKASKTKKINLINLDEIKFTWTSRDKNGLGYINFEHQKANNFYNSLLSIIKASASELCIKFLPLWEKNLNIYNDIVVLSYLDKNDDYFLIGKYINWEINFLRNLGYGLNIDICAVTGKLDDTFFISPKTGNAVCYNVGRKYSNKLFKIPLCMKENFRNNFYDDYLEALTITKYFFFKILERKTENFIFRDQLISHLRNL